MTYNTEPKTYQFYDEEIASIRIGLQMLEDDLETDIDIYKGDYYRIYPTEELEARLMVVQNVLRVIS